MCCIYTCSCLYKVWLHYILFICHHSILNLLYITDLSDIYLQISIHYGINYHVLLNEQ